MSYIMTADELKAKVDLALGVQTLYCNSAFGAPCGWGNNRTRYSKGQSASRARKIQNASDDTFLMDCVCSIKGFFWGWCADPNKQYGGAVYESNGLPDLTIDSIKAECSDWSQDFSNIQPMEFIRYSSTHCALYYGDGKVAESSPERADGFQLINLTDRNWEGHGKMPWVDYGTQPVPPEPPKPHIAEDGWWGQETTYALQEILGCSSLDGIVSRQPKSNKQYLPNASTSSWEFKGWPFYIGGSNVIKALQQRIDATPDGYFGRASVIALQEYLQARGYYAGAIDGSMGPGTVSGLQMWINANY